jgi:hypothetical protein
MTNTITIAKDRDFDESKTVLPAEVARGVYIENPPNAEALKLMHLLVGKAGGAMAEDRRHELRLADIKKIAGMRNHSRSTLRKLFTELAGAVIVYDDTDAQYEIIGGFLDQATLDYKDQINGDILISWWFGRAFRNMAEKSNHWAIIDRQTVFALASKYSILLFQHIASLVNMSHVSSKTFTVAELRSLLGVQEGKLRRWNDVNRFALQPAISEINQTSRLTLEATYHKTGRTVSSVSIAWHIKADIEPAKQAQADHSIARNGKLKAAQERLSFPATGSVKYSDPWERIARDNCNWDHSKIADAFRSFCAQRNISLDAKKIEEIFTNFCAKQPTI